MIPAIVVIGYNRPSSLKRLLTFLSKAHFKTANVPLIISLDYQDSEQHREVVVIANEFTWKYGTKRIIEHKTNLGLRVHVLTCGDLSEEYNAVIILEDDIIVSPYFYAFAQQALDKYENDSNIAGISLYGFEWSPVADRPFRPVHGGNDVYFMQNPQSWGQAWSKRMWFEFKQWYALHQDFSKATNVPDNVKTWSANSWLKYQLWYCVERNKYFVYPYVSLTTNFTDVGQHVKDINKSFQVPLLMGKRLSYHLPDFDDSCCKYDVFFERQGIGAALGIEGKDLCTDLYEKKKNIEKKKYWLTPARANYKIIKSFALELKPHELNVLFNMEGSDIFLYDTTIEAINKETKQLFRDVNKTLYDIRDTPAKKLVEVVLFRMVNKLKGVTKKIKF